MFDTVRLSAAAWRETISSRRAFVVEDGLGSICWYDWIINVVKTAEKRPVFMRGQCRLK